MASEPFHEKFGLVLKALVLTRGQVAMQLGIDKSLVGRWATGPAQPSAHNLIRLTDLVAARLPHFTALDWDRDLQGLAAVLGVDPAVLPGAAVWKAPNGLPIPLLDQMLSSTTSRAAAYEGFFITTRPYFQRPGAFIHDYLMVRRAPNGLLAFRQGTGGVLVEGWLLALNGKLFMIGAERTNDSMVFCIINGVNAAKAEAFEGLALHCAFDAGRTPLASPVVAVRVRDLGDDRDADDAWFAEFAARPYTPAEGSISAELSAHLARNAGPNAFASGGDWMLSMPVARSMSRGLD